MKGTVMTVQSLSRRLSSCLFAVIVGSALTVVSAPLPASAACVDDFNTNLDTEAIQLHVWDPVTSVYFDLEAWTRVDLLGNPKGWHVPYGGTCNDINVRNLNPPPPLVEPKVSSTWWSSCNYRWTWGTRHWVVALPGGVEIQTLTSIFDGGTYCTFSRNSAMLVRIRA